MLIKVQHAAVNLCCDVEGQQVWRTFTLMSGMTCGVAAGSCTDRTEPASPSTCSGLISSLQRSSLFIHTHVLSPCLCSAFIPTFCPCSCSWFQLVANMTTNSGDQQSAWPPNSKTLIYKKPKNRIFFFKFKMLTISRMLLCPSNIYAFTTIKQDQKLSQKNA